MISKTRLIVGSVLFAASCSWALASGNAQETPKPTAPRVAVPAAIEGWPFTGLVLNNDAPSELSGLPQSISPDQGSDETAYPIPLDSAQTTLARVERHMLGSAPVWPQGNPKSAQTDPAVHHEARGVLERMLADQDPNTRLRGLEALGEETSEEALELLLEAVIDDHREVRETALRLLQEQTPRDLARRIIELLATAPEPMRMALDQALPALSDNLQEPMTQILADDSRSEAEHTWAAYVLGRTRSVESLHVLAQRLWTAENPRLMEVCAQAIASSEDPRAQPYLVQMAGHSHPAVKRAAVHGLAGLGGSQALSVISNIASGRQEMDIGLRAEAITLLAQIGDERAIPTLIQILQHSPQLETSAANALYQLTGQPLGRNPSVWIQWYQQMLAERGQQPEEGQQQPTQQLGPQAPQQRQPEALPPQIFQQRPGGGAGTPWGPQSPGTPSPRPRDDR